MKFKVDEIKNITTGKITPVIVKSTLPCKIRDILIGGGAVLFGIGYLTAKAFVSGIDSYSAAEFDALNEAGLIKKTDDGMAYTEDYNVIKS